MSPEFVIRRFERIMGTYGFEEVKHGRFKREREAWISAVWALGLRETMERIDYWIEIETRDQTPDCKVQFFDTTNGYNHLKIFKVEIVEWEQHREDVLDVISAKCKKSYPNYFVLVVLARNGKVIEMLNLLKTLEDFNIPFAEMWILGRMAATKYGMSKIHPNNWTVEFDLARALQNDKRNTGLLERQQRGMSTEWTDLGSEFLPIP